VPVAFFDIGETLGSVRVSPPPYRLLGLDIYPYVPAILNQLRNNGVRIGVISNTGSETAEDMKNVLEECQLYGLFEPDLLIYSSVVGLEKNSPEVFKLAAQHAGFASTPEQCLFVGEDREERRYALEAGLQVAPHVILAWDVLTGSRLRYIRATVPSEQAGQGWRRVMRRLPVVPLHLTGEEGSKVYAITTTVAATRLDDLGFEVDRLGGIDDPLTTDVYLLRDDRQARAGFLAEEGESARVFGGNDESTWVLASSREGLYIALPAGHSISEYHFDEARHGHTLKLLPDVNLLEPFGEGENARSAAWLVNTVEEPSLSVNELERFGEISPEVIRGYVERYTGVNPLDDNSSITIGSRHIASDDNALAVEALAGDLHAIGGDDLSVSLHRFVHDGHALYNVEAELRGSDSDEIVLVSAHLDSTAAFSEDGFDPKTDPAPGADDDCSGTAAVLAVASVIGKLAGIQRPKRTIRFVLFNAEEEGLIGSKAYARAQAAMGSPIIAVYQMDMVGYKTRPPHIFEVHVGYPAAEVQERSLTLARRIDRLTKQISPELEQPEIYPAAGPDPAAGRSDHASFQERGYAACAVSENFFAGPAPDSPAPETNPNYHKKSDTFVNYAYAADIARVVGAAAWLTANL
jgi:bacterial leucyl aminopeptidase